MARSRKKQSELQKKYMLRFVAMIALISMVVIWASSLTKPQQPPKTRTLPSVTVDSTRAFIISIAGTAKQVSRDHKIYASVLIAQAILESNHGQSALSQAPYHNLFGMKGNYQGQSVTLPTWEDDGQGNSYQIETAFRVYPSHFESIQDYAALLSTNKYAGVWKTNTSSYREATKALTGLYATDTSYASKLNDLIEKYHLTNYDR